jgi:hypothetical protein
MSALVRRWSFLRRVTESVAGRLIVVFVFYLIADIGYGCWYFSLYRTDSTRFLFAADIAVAQRAAHSRAIVTELAEARRKSTPLEAFLQSLRGDSSVTFAHRELRGHQGTVQFHDDGGMADCPQRDRFPCTFGNVRVLDRQGASVAEIAVDMGSLLDLSSETTARAALFDLAAQLKERRARLEAELADDAALARNSWTYIDFLYFSTITQMTVGYGDIAPNSAIVRLVVMSQLAVNGFFLLVVLNFILASPIFSSVPPKPSR